MTSRDFGYPILNELDELVNRLDAAEPLNQKLITEAQTVIRLGETAHGARHRNVLAPELIEKIKRKLN